MPPVWLGGNGSLETYEMALKNNYVYSWTSFFGFQTGKKFMLDFWDTQEQMGGLEFNPYQGGYCQIVLVADTDARRVACTSRTSSTSSRTCSTYRCTSAPRPGTGRAVAQSSPSSPAP